MHYIGLDVHKQSVSYCSKTAAGELVEEGRIDATREALASWAQTQPPWRGAMEATLFSGWIHDTLAPYADDLAVGHPAAMEAITRVRPDRLPLRIRLLRIDNAVANSWLEEKTSVYSGCSGLEPFVISVDFKALVLSTRVRQLCQKTPL